MSTHTWVIPHFLPGLLAGMCKHVHCHNLSLTMFHTGVCERNTHALQLFRQLSSDPTQYSMLLGGEDRVDNGFNVFLNVLDTIEIHPSSLSSVTSPQQLVLSLLCECWIEENVISWLPWNAILSLLHSTYRVLTHAHTHTLTQAIRTSLPDITLQVWSKHVERYIILMLVVMLLTTLSPSEYYTPSLIFSFVL